ncbi:MAG TPA: hypothetical protein VHB79_38900 [Polyangiaceae bacterium]|nr:hypothetical protein [Polyangiaceae bacterium]
MVERQQRPEAELVRAARLPAVPVDHLAGPVARPIRYPRLASTVGQRQRHEGRSEVVHAQLAPVGAIGVELGAGGSSGVQARPQALGQPVLGRERSAVVVHEHIVIRSGAAHRYPDAQCPNGAGVERPAPWIVGFVVVQAHGPGIEVEVAHLQREGLALAAPLAAEKAEEQSKRERRRGVLEQSRVFGRV